MIMAGNKGDFHDDSQINNKTWSPFPFYGIETMTGIHRPDFTYDPTVEWGHMRAMLNHADNGNDAFQGNYLHGKIRPEDYTHGCICERSEQILNMIWKLNTQVPVEVK